MKDKKYINNYPNRIIEKNKNFFNGFKNDDINEIKNFSEYTEDQTFKGVFYVILLRFAKYVYDIILKKIIKIKN